MDATDTLLSYHAVPTLQPCKSSELVPQSDLEIDKFELLAILSCAGLPIYHPDRADYFDVAETFL